MVLSSSVMDLPSARPGSSKLCFQEPQYKPKSHKHNTTQAVHLSLHDSMQALLCIHITFEIDRHVRQECKHISSK